MKPLLHGPHLAFRPTVYRGAVQVTIENALVVGPFERVISLLNDRLESMKASPYQLHITIFEADIGDSLPNPSCEIQYLWLTTYQD